LQVEAGFVKPENARTYVASFRDRSMRVREIANGYLWEVTNAVSGEEVAHGEAVSRETAMVSAAEAAGADWGSARWRSPGDDDE
jgi:hypothetical protein